jgi:hypothetical protein
VYKKYEVTKKLIYLRLCSYTGMGEQSRRQESDKKREWEKGGEMCNHVNVPG